MGGAPRMVSSGRRWVGLATLIGRTIIVAELLPNGLGKLSDFSAMAAGMGGVPTTLHGHPFPGAPLLYFPIPSFFLGCSVLFDLLGAVLIIIGLFARPVGIWLASYCLLAIAIYHSALSDPENLRALLRNLPLVGGVLFIGGVGAGPWSLDAYRASRGGGGHRPAHPQRVYEPVL